MGAVWRRLRGVGRCRGVAQGYATRGVHGHEGTCRASGRDAARLVAGLGQACSAAYPQGRAQRWRSLPGKYRRTGYAARGHVRRSVSCLGGAAISVRGRSGLGQEGDFRAGAFRVWSGQRSPRRSVSRLGGTAIFTRGTFRAWAGGRFSRRNVLCPGGTAAFARGRSGSGRDGDLCAGGVSCMGGTAITAQEAFCVWAGQRFSRGRRRSGRARLAARGKCPHALYGSGGATISSFSAAGASVAAQSRQSPTSARHRQAIRCPRRNTSVSPAQRVRKPPARPSPVSFR